MLGLIGVPSSAGAHGPGQEKAPGALRQAGLLGALRETGLTVEDLGDLPVTRFQPDPANRKSQSLSRVVMVARQVADRVATAVDRDLVPLVLGGDCSITLGVVAGLLRRQPDLGLMYFDGDADLTTPDTTHSGIFDSMGVAHLIGDSVVSAFFFSSGISSAVFPCVFTSIERSATCSGRMNSFLCSL